MRMRKLLVMLASFFFLAVNMVAVQGASKVNISTPPKIFQAVGAGQVIYEPTRWPDFYAYSSDNPSCGNYLKRNLSLKPKGNAYPRTILSKKIDFNKDIGEIYKKTAKIIVVWTVRIEAQKVTINPWTSGLCHPWHGVSYQRFYKGKSGGDAYTYLYVNGKQKGKKATMTFPPLGTGVNVNMYDPTVTGSVVLTADDFGGEFPDELTFEVRWVNDTYGGMIISPSYTRSMVITVFPQGK